MRYIHELLGKEDKKEFIRKCATDFGFFCRRVLNLNVAPFHVEWAKMFFNNKRSCVTAFRSAGKTTICGVAFPLWIFTFDNIVRKMRKDKEPAKIMVISNVMGQSTRIIQEVRNKISGEEFLSTCLSSDYGNRT